MPRQTFCLLGLALLLAAVGTTGCDNAKDKPPTDSSSDRTKPDEVAAERAKLDPGDRALVEAQEWCVVQTDELLGSMGPPLKLDVKGRPVFVCCKGCKRKAEADPDGTLTKVEELKAKAKADRETRK